MNIGKAESLGDSLGRRLAGFLALLVVAGVLPVLNAIQATGLILAPFSRKASRWIACHTAEIWWHWLLWTYFGVQKGEKIVLTGDPIPAGENAVIIANHQSMVDVFFLLYLGQRVGRMRDIKWFAKDALKVVPGVGWGLWLMDCIYVKRNWMSDRHLIDRAFRKFKAEKIPFWLITFLEGTRKTPEKLKLSQDYARKVGLPVPKNVMLPRTKGFVATVQGLSGSLDAIYDVTIDYRGPAITFGEMILGKLKPVHVHFKRYSVSELPQDPQKLSDWAFERFYEKDLRIQA